MQKQGKNVAGNYVEQKSLINDYRGTYFFLMGRFLISLFVKFKCFFFITHNYIYFVIFVGQTKTFVKSLDQNVNFVQILTK